MKYTDEHMYSDCLVLIALARLNAYERDLELDGERLICLIIAVCRARTGRVAANFEIQLAVSAMVSIFSIDVTAALLQMKGVSKSNTTKLEELLIPKLMNLLEIKKIKLFLSSKKIDEFRPNGNEEKALIHSKCVDNIVNVCVAKIV